MPDTHFVAYNKISDEFLFRKRVHRAASWRFSESVEDRAPKLLGDLDGSTTLVK